MLNLQKVIDELVAIVNVLGSDIQVNTYVRKDISTVTSIKHERNEVMIYGEELDTTGSESLKADQIISKLKSIATTYSCHIPVRVCVHGDISDVVLVTQDDVGSVVNGELVDTPEIFIRGWKY